VDEMFKAIRKIIKNEKGASLVEAIIALGLLGLIATAFTMAIFVSTKSIMIADERTNAESLARAQMEYVKQQVYIYNDTEWEYDPLNLVGTQYSEGTPYSIWSVDSSDSIVEGVVAVPWDSQSDVYATPDVGLQKITIKIFHGDDNEVLTLEGYKVDEGVY
jgi:type II secretory pathway pseudopilin PulG